MKKERHKQILEIIKKENEKDVMDSYYHDHKDAEVTLVSLNRLREDSPAVNKLKNSGFHVIYPPQLSETDLEKMPPSKREQYKVATKYSPTAHVIDKGEENLTLGLANKLAKMYFKFNPYSLTCLPGYNKDNNSMTYDLGKNPYTEKFNELLKNIGYESELDKEGRLSVYSDIPYPHVKKTKFEKIYDKAKNGINKILSFFKNKPGKTGKEFEIDGPE